MKFEYYAVVTENGFHQGGNGTPALFKKKYTAHRIAHRYERAGRKAAVVIFHAVPVAAERPNAQTNKTAVGTFLTVKDLFPGAF